jgi:putative ABC transport system permease protein
MLPARHLHMQTAKRAHMSIALLVDGWRNSCAAIGANPVRAALSMASVAIGVSLLVTIIGFVHAIRQGVGSDLGSSEALMFYVFREPLPDPQCSVDPAACPVNRNPALTVREADVLRSLNIVREILLHASWTDSISAEGDERNEVTVDAYGPGWLEVTGNRITDGRDFTMVEHRLATPAVLLPTEIAERLFGNQRAIGRNVRFAGAVLRVIGVYRPATSPIGRFSSGAGAHVVIPMEVARRRLAADLSSLNFVVKPIEDVDQLAATRLVGTRLRAVRRLGAGEAANFSIITQSQLLDLYEGVSTGFHVVIIVMGLSSLVVGGVGILTIMTITVSERTQEIGLRKALGATRPAILTQFLTEACLISAAGTSAGLATSAVILTCVAIKFGLTGAVTPPVIAGGALFGTLVGGTFGLAPAFRASSMSPLDALHHL